MNIWKKIERMIFVEKQYFLIITLPLAGISNDPQEVFNELALRGNPMAEVTRMESMAEANLMAFQRYGIQFYGHRQEPNMRPMSLPVEGTFMLSTGSSSVAGFNPQLVSCPVDFGGNWGICASNGFGSGFDLSGMVTALQNDKLVYPQAMWFQDYNRAFEWARNSYVRRFFSRFVGTAIAPRIPSPEQMPPGHMFIDSYYETNESNRQESDELTKFLSYGLI